VQKAGFYETHPSEKAALIDINNDGKKEIIISLELASGRGPGCDSTFLGVLTEDRRDIDKKFTERLPGGKCGGTKVTPFVLDGKTYLDERQTSSHAEHRQIYMLEKDQLKTICEFEVRPENYVLSKIQRIEKAAEYQNPWLYAISQPGLETVKTLIESERDINEDTGHGYFPLHIAVHERRDDVLALLLKVGANPNLKSKDFTMMTPLHNAVWNGTDRAVELLLKYGAKAVEDKSDSYNALYEAMSISESLNKLELLLKYGTIISEEVAIEAVTNRNKNKYEKLKLLLKYGLDVNKKYTKTVVVEGIKQEAPGVWKVGPEIKSKKMTKTLLEWAKESGDPEAVKILTDAGAKKADKSLLQKLKEVDADLNQNYKLLASNLNEADRKKLQAEQKDWIHERDTKCDSFYKSKSIENWLRNAASDEKRARCVLETTQMRIHQLLLKLFPEVVPPDEVVEGRNQSEWSHEYWRWHLSFSADEKLSGDISDMQCAKKQSGPVWFLAGGISSDPIVRHCEIPAGRHVFIPVLASLTRCTKQDMEQNKNTHNRNDVPITDMTDLRVEIDGKQISNLTSWRKATDCFMLQTTEGAIPADYSDYWVSDGYWVILKPLHIGKHTIKFGGRFLTYGVSKNVQYNLTVK